MGEWEGKVSVYNILWIVPLPHMWQMSIALILLGMRNLQGISLNLVPSAALLGAGQCTCSMTGSFPERYHDLFSLFLTLPSSQSPPPTRAEPGVEWSCYSSFEPSDPRAEYLFLTSQASPSCLTFDISTLKGPSSSLHPPPCYPTSNKKHCTCSRPPASSGPAFPRPLIWTQASCSLTSASTTPTSPLCFSQWVSHTFSIILQLNFCSASLSSVGDLASAPLRKLRPL